MNIQEQIKKDRPTLKDNSINAYVTVLRKLNGDEEVCSLDFLAKKENIMEQIKDFKLTTKRNYLTGILVVLKAYKANQKLIDFYKNQINVQNEEYNNIMAKNNKSEKQEKNWLELKELDTIFKSLEKKVKGLDLKNRIEITTADLFLIQDYVVAGLYTLLPPVRLDFSPMAVVGAKHKLDDNINYLINVSRTKKYFKINQYKNIETHGVQYFQAPKKLNSVLNIWLKYNNSGTLLLNNRKEALSSNGLGKLITKVFAPTEKNVTINLLRSIYISEKVDIDAVKKNKNIADDMMHTVNTQQKIYYKS